MQRDQNPNGNVTDIDISRVLHMARQRLKTPINSVLDDEVSVSQRNSRGLVFDCVANKAFVK